MPRRGSKAPSVVFMNYPERLPNGPQGPEFGGFGQVVRNVEVYACSSSLLCFSCIVYKITAVKA